MKLEIHKASADTADAVIEMSEVFPEHYSPEQIVEVCNAEATALVDALNATLPRDTKAALVRLIVHGQVY